MPKVKMLVKGAPGNRKPKSRDFFIFREFSVRRPAA